MKKYVIKFTESEKKFLDDIMHMEDRLASDSKMWLSDTKSQMDRGRRLITISNILVKLGYGDGFDHSGDYAEVGHWEE